MSLVAETTPEGGIEARTREFSVTQMWCDWRYVVETRCVDVISGRWIIHRCHYLFPTTYLSFAQSNDNMR
jgi:hypothetical protein